MSPQLLPTSKTTPSNKRREAAPATAAVTSLESRYRAVLVRPGADALIVLLDDGREVTTSYERFPRLAQATAAQRRNWEFIGRGTGIHWPQLDEDISVFSIVHPELTQPSREP